MRHRLKKDYGIEGGIPVVFSLEKPKVKLLPFKGPTGEKENPSDYQVRIISFFISLFTDFFFILVYISELLIILVSDDVTLTLK